MKFVMQACIAVALLAAAPAVATGPFTDGTGYIDSHLAQFREHVNNVRAGKCMRRFVYVKSADELAALTADSRRHVRVGWKRRHWRAHQAASRCTPWYVTAQIRAATIIGRESRGDPWPNCPDPFDGGGHTWADTVNCENGGSWRDSPGFYRCGLQFHPDWERRFGRLCP